jgi:UDP-N-acetylmuramate dehydrogenase
MQQNISLKKYNTFGIDVSAKYFASFSTVQSLQELFDIYATQKDSSVLQPLILGGGSNILFTKNFDGLVLKNELKGVTLVNEDDEFVYVKAAAGENWHQFVLYCIDNNWAGVENLSLIPGNVGASPMQNIGAYGVEIKDVFYSLEAYSISDKRIIVFNALDCAFGYRESVFKNKYKNKFVITSVTFKLSKKPRFNIAYGAITQELEQMGVKDLSIKAVSDAVINIRSSKLPNPAQVGNAGSFFKNPEVSLQQYEMLKAAHSDIVGYNLLNDNVKLAAGWLIEHCGPDGTTVSWKGYSEGDAGCHVRQALVLVNYGNATGIQVYELSEKILQTVKNKFGITLEREVNVI